MKAQAKALISKGLWSGRTKDVIPILGQGLQDEREEMFVILVCDGLPMGLAFRRAGFSSKSPNAPHALLALPRVQERAAAILEARRSTGVVTLAEVTSMLQRVFAGAHSEGEYNAAHNAAFSLARLYGHVTDRATLEVIRRPSRDPDAPSEQALEAWASSLPVVSPEGPSPEALPKPPEALGGPSPEASNLPPRGAPAALLGPEPSGPEPYQPIDIIEDFKARDGGGETGNGAPVGPVTGTPNECGGTGLLENGAPDKAERVPAPIGGWPSFDELFGE